MLVSIKRIEIGRRAVACEGWRWLPGMLLEGGFRVLNDSDDYPHAVNPETGFGTTNPRRLPDFSDPATLGALVFGLALDVLGWEKTLACLSEAWKHGTHLDPCPAGAEWMGIAESVIESLEAESGPE